MPLTKSTALTRRYPGISEETLATGLLSSTPQIPDDDLDTVGLQWLLVGQSAMSANTAGELARTIYENKAELALDDGFASKIEPADVDKSAFVAAHQGVAEYINDTPSLSWNAIATWGISARPCSASSARSLSRSIPR